ncbi:hypothetical protein IL099_002473 [Enterococcus hirae]|nr:hypothetical protein [Enterococcus hirae]
MVNEFFSVCHFSGYAWDFLFCGNIFDVDSALFAVEIIKRKESRKKKC